MVKCLVGSLAMITQVNLKFVKNVTPYGGLPLLRQSSNIFGLKMQLNERSSTSSKISQPPGIEIVWHFLDWLVVMY